MLSTWTSRAAGWRRIVMAMTLTLVALVASVGFASAQAAPAAQPAAQPAQQPPRTVNGDVGLIFNTIKPDKTEDFEKVIAKLKDAFAKTQDPAYKEMAKGFRVIKSSDAINGNFLYVFLIDPAVKDADYTIMRILQKEFPAEVQDLFKMYSSAFAGGVSVSSYKTVADMRK